MSDGFPFGRNRDWLENERPPSTSYGDGWAGVVADLVDAIGAVVRPSGLRITVFDAKEKYASLRVDWAGDLPDELRARVERLVMAAELRSAGTCEVCALRGRVRESAGGWLAARCDDHADGFERLVGEDPAVWKVGDGRGSFFVHYDHEAGVLVETPA